ncbi:hypothetical protein D3C76_1040580 [compost metagenome]
MVGDHQRLCPDAYRPPRVFSVEDALENQRARPQAAQPLDVGPGDARVELAVDPVLERVEVARIRNLCAEATEHQRLAAQYDIPQPAGAGEYLPRPDQGRPQSAGVQPVAGVPVAHAGQWQVHGEQQCPAAAGPGFFQQGAHDASVAQHVQLEPTG